MYNLDSDDAVDEIMAELDKEAEEEFKLPVNMTPPTEGDEDAKEDREE